MDSQTLLLVTYNVDGNYIYLTKLPLGTQFYVQMSDQSREDLNEANLLLIILEANVIFCLHMACRCSVKPCKILH